VNRFFRSVTITFVVFAVAFSGVLLAKDAGMEILPQLNLHVVSAVSLLLVGAAFLTVQPVMRLRPKEVLKNVLLAAAFMLWGIVQLMPQNVLSTRLGNLVIALFVMDLARAALLSARTQGSVQTHAAGCASRQIEDSGINAT
jgi:hypothetical protein